MTENKNPDTPKPKRKRLKRGDKDYINNEQLTLVLGKYSKEDLRKTYDEIMRNHRFLIKMAKKALYLIVFLLHCLLYYS